MSRRFVALDRDGTLIVERHYLHDPEGVELLPGVTEGLRHVRKLGMGLIVVTNQSGIGRGLFDEHQVARVHQRLAELLEVEGITLDGIYVCPHTPEDGCDCRKPRAGLLHRAAQDLSFQPGRCFVIGDKACDVDLGRAVGATTFLVRTGYGVGLAAEGAVRADHVVDSLAEAAAVMGRLVAGDDAEPTGTDVQRARFRLAGSGPRRPAGEQR